MKKPNLYSQKWIISKITIYDSHVHTYIKNLLKKNQP